MKPTWMAATTAGIIVAIILDRVQDPTTLLSQNWGERQQALAGLEDAGTLWEHLRRRPGAVRRRRRRARPEPTASPYSTGTPPTATTCRRRNRARSGWRSTRRRSSWNCSAKRCSTATAATTASCSGTATSRCRRNGTSRACGSIPTTPRRPRTWRAACGSPCRGPQSIGNTTASIPTGTEDIAALYNFPLVGQSDCDGHDRPDRAGYRRRCEETRAKARSTSGWRTTCSRSARREPVQSTFRAATAGYFGEDSGERSLDVGVVSAINPNSDIGLYVGSGNKGNAYFLDLHRLSECDMGRREQPGHPLEFFGNSQSMSPDSPFYQAYWQLYVDAALRNPTIFSALGDGGSGNETGNGLTNVEINLTSPYAVLVGPTSLSTITTAEGDPTLPDRPAPPRRRSRDDLAARCRRPDQPAERRERATGLRRGRRGTPTRSTAPLGTSTTSTAVTAEHDDVRRRRPDAAGALVPDGLRPRYR